MEQLRVLIAEDEIISRRILQRAIEQAGHRCTATADGDAAWEAFKTTEVDVVISDWMMPGMNGLELCQHIRDHESAPYTYFVLLTALDDKTHFLEGMEAGADDYLGKPFDPQELQARLLAAGRVVTLHRSLARQNAELAELNMLLAESARTDPLTGLGNRLRLWEDLESTQSQAVRYGSSYAIAMCDVDRFKAYNDQYGHPAGDTALQAVAQTLATQCRTGDRAYRYGGEEFLIILPEQSSVGASTSLNRIREAVKNLAITHAGNPPQNVLTISGGIAIMAPGATGTSESLVAHADAALYAAKEGGRDQIAVYQGPAPLVS